MRSLGIAKTELLMAQKLDEAWEALDQVSRLVGDCSYARSDAVEDRRDWATRVRALRACVMLARERLEHIRSQERPGEKRIPRNRARKRVLDRLVAVGADVVPDMCWKLVERDRREALSQELRERWEERREKDARWRAASPNAQKEKRDRRRKARLKSASDQGRPEPVPISVSAREMRIRAGVE